MEFRRFSKSKDNLKFSNKQKNSKSFNRYNIPLNIRNQRNSKRENVSDKQRNNFQRCQQYDDKTGNDRVDLYLYSGNDTQYFRKCQQYDYKCGNDAQYFRKFQQYDDKSGNDIQYFRRVLDRLKQGFDDKEEKDLFTNNVLQQTEGKELEVSFRRVSSYCIQTLLEICTDFQIIKRFMNSFSECPNDVCVDQFASHITEALLRAGLKLMQISEHHNVLSDEGNEDTHEIVTFVTKWILFFGHFCLENIDKLLVHMTGSHVLRTVVEVLGGHEVEKNLSQRKKARNRRINFQSNLDDFGSKVQPAVLNVPKEFLKLLKKISVKVLKSEHIIDYAMDSTVSPLLQTILLVMQKNRPKLCKKLVNRLIDEVFTKENDKKVPAILTNKNSSYFIEKLIVTADREQLACIWEEHIKSCLKELIEHPVGGFIVQNLLYSVTDKMQYEAIFDEMSNYFDNILVSNHNGIMVALANACNRLSARQAQFIKALMECLHCLEPETRCCQFVSLLLKFTTYECNQSKQAAEEISALEITLHGSLLLQELLKFHKPIKIVNGILALKPEELSILSCSIQGYHILTAFLQSQSVGEKSKDKLIQCLKVAEIALGQHGSKTLARIWDIASLKQKCIIAKELAYKEKLLNSNPWSRGLLSKFAVHHFKNRQEEWKQIQSTNFKKRKMFDDIIEGTKKTKNIPC